jgi:DNA-binding NarL/FixJ family response regulator
MRVVLVGTPEQRRRLREAVGGAPVQIVGEAATIAAARASGLAADGWLLAPSAGPIGAADETVTVHVEPLTPRETGVLELVAEGLPNKAIGSRLSISDQTVKFHVASICAKLGATNRTDAVRRALERGLITL